VHDAGAHREYTHDCGAVWEEIGVDLNFFDPFCGARRTRLDGLQQRGKTPARLAHEHGAVEQGLDPSGARSQYTAGWWASINQ
jgi:hypothetical protein